MLLLERFRHPVLGRHADGRKKEEVGEREPNNKAKRKAGNPFPMQERRRGGGTALEGETRDRERARTKEKRNLIGCLDGPSGVHISIYFVKKKKVCRVQLVTIDRQS